MADMKFEVDYKSLQRANEELVRTGKVSKTSGDAFTQAFKQVNQWQQKFSLEQGKVNALLEKQHLSQNLASKSARESANAFKQQAVEIERLSNKYKPLYASSKLYETELSNLDRAHKLNVLSTQQHEAALEQLNKEYANGVGRFSTYANAMGKGANRMGVAMQQTGYQVGDFLVQVQSGTNPMVAFGQQATQLVGIMYLLPQATMAARVGIMGLQVSLASIALGLGIAIPLITAIGAAWMKSSQASNEAASGLRTYTDAAKEASDAVAKLRLEEAARQGGFGNELEYELFQGLVEAQDAFNEAKLAANEADAESALILNEKLVLAQKELETRQEALKTYQDEVRQAEIAKQLEEARLSSIELFYENRAKAEEDAAQRARAVAEIIAAREEAIKSETQSLENQIKIAELSSQYGQDSLAVRQELVAQERAAYAVQLRGQGLRRDEVADLLNVFDTLKGIEEQQRQAAEEEKSRLSAIQLFYENRAKQEAEIEERNRKVAEIIAEREKFVADETKTLEDQLVVARLIQQHGEDSVEVRQKIAEQEREAYVVELDRLRIRGEERTLLLELFDAMQKVTEETQAAADALKNISPNLQAAIDQANRFADAMGRARSESAGIGISTTGIQAQIAALQSGATEAQAAATAAAVTLREQLVAEAGGNVGRGTGARIEAQVAERYQQTLAQEQARETLRGLQDTGKSGGGKDTPYIQQLKAELEYKTRVVGMSEEQARREEILYELNKREEVATEAQINQVVAMEEALRKATEAEEERQKMFDIVETNLESAMMSLVDGSMTVTDAFRNMLRNILLAIYQEQVAKKTANFITSLFMANGGAFNKGVQMFADGGVVSSPTLFGHAGGIGMMGEAGPEAIMPLKRGPDGKLGVKADNQAQGNIVINQSFNFAANGDDSVKKLIAEAAPRIAQMTQNQIIDSRRRGGQMKAAFG